MIILVVIVGILTLMTYFKSDRKIPFVKLAEVYSSFSLTKELDIKYKSIENQKKNYLDSLDFEARKLATSSQYTVQSYENMVQYYVNRRTELEKSNEELSQMYQEQIWKQINSYVERYGKLKGYDYILGAQGTGTVMYADSENDITKEFIEYLNQSYDGKAN